MSHYTVIVFGDKVAEQLAPFNEENINYELVPVKDLLAEYLLKTGEVVSDATAMKFIKNYVKTNREPVAIVEEEWLKDDMVELYRGELASTGYYTYMTFNAKGELNLVHRRDFSKSKWDWFQIGGRWPGWLIPKSGIYSVGRVKWFDTDENYVGRGAFDSTDIHEGGQNRLRKKDIDFEKMIELHLKEKMEFFKTYHPRRQYHTSFEGHLDNQRRKLRIQGIEYDESEPMWRSQNPEVCKAYRDAIKKYWSQPSCSGDLNLHFWNPAAADKFFKMTRKEFIEVETAKAFLPYAFVIDGVWHERGQMGLFGALGEEEDYLTFAKRFKEALDSVSDDTHITVVDCHS